MMQLYNSRQPQHSRMIQRLVRTAAVFFLEISAAGAFVLHRRVMTHYHGLLLAFNPDAVHTDDGEEWHPHDPAWTTPRLLQGIWDQIAHANTMVKGVRLCLLSAVFVV